MSEIELLVIGGIGSLAVYGVFRAIAAFVHSWRKLRDRMRSAEWEIKHHERMQEIHSDQINRLFRDKADAGHHHRGTE